jgi:hypothetical protein
MDSTPARIVVELIPGAAPISGHVSCLEEEPRPFVGWTGLFAALRAIAVEDGSSSDGAGSRGSGDSPPEEGKR